MKFRYTILYVKDVAESLSFFETAFGFRTKMLHEGGDYGELDTGGTILAFSSRELMKRLGKKPGAPDPASPVFEIALETDDVTAGVARALEAGAKLESEPACMDWGQTIAYVSEPNDFLIEICTPVSG